MEFRLTVLAVLLAVALCSVTSHSVERRQAYDDANYDDPFVADEASDYETQNDGETNAKDTKQSKKEPAVILTNATTYEAMAGGNVLMECKVSPENGTVVQWYKDQVVIFVGNLRLIYNDRLSIAPKSKDLQIKSVDATDAGIYKCEIAQKVMAAVNHTLVILEPPTVVGMSATNGGGVTEDSDVTLTCRVTGVPPPDVIWSVTKASGSNMRLTEKDGEFTVSDNLYSMNVKKIRPDQAGKYYCYALNSKGSDQGEITVVVNRKPKVHVPKTVINSDLRVEAVLQCSAHEEPTPSIRWYKDGVFIEDSKASQFSIATSGTHSNLTVIPIADEDFGTFTCEAVNVYGKHNRSIELVQSPVVEDIMVDGSKITWVVTSHQPLEELEVQIRDYTGNGEWKTLSVPVPEGKDRKYEITYILENSQVDAGRYQAIIKAKNNKSWASAPVNDLVEIKEPQMVIRPASVIGGHNGAVPMQAGITSLAFMYLLVRML